MRLPWRSRPSEPVYPDVEFAFKGKKFDVARLARFVRARLADDAAVVNRYARSRGRAELPEGFTNVLCDHERQTRKPADAEKRVRVLQEYIAGLQAKFAATEASIQNDRRVGEQQFFDMIAYTHHWETHPEFDRAWSLINFMDMG
jgi:hypothetical protein